MSKPFDLEHSNINAGQHVSVMQFTGLQDRTGKDIYEGDILQYYDQKGYRMGTRINIVKWQNTKSATGFNIAVTRRCEVIGNIYENQDLL